MEGLLPVFVQGGITDRACFNGLVLMTNAQQKQYLDGLPLNQFQNRIILNGLSALRGTFSQYE